MTFSATGFRYPAFVHPLEIPEHALSVFERLHGLQVTVHDLAGNLSPFLRPNRFYHRSPLCVTVKACGRAHACLEFENNQLRRDLAYLPEGRIHVCHANFVEWVVPAYGKDGLNWIVFAGIRAPGRQLVSAFRARVAPWPKPPWARGTVLPRPVDEPEAQEILEHLRQLAARLRIWSNELRPGIAAPRAAPTVSTTPRQTLILRFIELHYANHLTLAQLARELGLSEDRASHVVRQTCGANFRELLIQKRLRVATELLRQSGLGVLEVALASGFEDVAHFHRLFRRRIGTTPARYRVRGQT